MSDFLSNAKKELSSGFRDAGDQQDVLEELLKKSGEYRLDLLRWEMKDHNDGFDYPRIQAGLEFINLAPKEGWEILEQLIKSNNDNDRSTACSIFEELNDSRSYPLMKPLLDDKYASLQFEACDFLKDVYPKEVEETLNNLLVNKYEDVRNAAKKRLIELNK